MSNTTSNKNLEIEALRGAAVLLTMVTHLPILLPYHREVFSKIFAVVMPSTGVDLFFCISGYVVSKAYIDLFDQQRAQGQFWTAVQAFWIRRVYRLLPSAWLWLVVGLLCSIFFNHSGIFSSWFENLRSATAVMTFSGNFANQFGLLLHPNEVYWSLALEEQFYMLFPLFLFIVLPHWRWRLLLLMVAVQFFLDRNVFGSRSAALVAAFRLDSIMWGVLIFLFSRTLQYRQFEPVFLRNAKLSTMLCNALLVYLLIAVPAQLIAVPVAMGMVALITALLVFMASFAAGYIVHIPVLTPFLIGLGARSYGVYLIHVVAYRLTFEGWSRYADSRGAALNPHDTVPMLLTALLLIVILAEFNFRVIEVPLRNRGTVLAKQRMEQLNA
jgi:peptidoglycan/LPS O-acetylase OafA/YrhL